MTFLDSIIGKKINLPHFTFQAARENFKFVTCSLSLFILAKVTDMKKPIKVSLRLG